MEISVTKGTVASKTVEFDTPFPVSPQVVITPNVSSPQYISAGVTGVGTGGFTVNLFSEVSTNTYMVRWIAVS